MSAELHAALRAGTAAPPEEVRGLLLAARGAAPTWHPTGFMVAKLWDGEAGALRLHVWPADDRCYGDPLWPVHDHVWPLSSHVLVGRIHCRSAEIVPDPDGDHRRYVVDYGVGARSRLKRYGGAVRLRLSSVRRVAAGGGYDVAAGCFHTSSGPPGQLAATLVAVGAPERDRPFVLGPPDGPSEIPVVRRAVEPMRWQALLSELCSRLGSSTTTPIRPSSDRAGLTATRRRPTRRGRGSGRTSGAAS